MARPCLLLPALALLASLAGAQIVVDLHPHRPHVHPVPRRPAPVTLESHHVQVDVKGGTATTRVTQVFRNPNRFGVEGTYLFPLPEGAAVGRFAMKMGDKMVEGEVLEKEEAARIYQSIVSRMKDPALLEYVGRNLFKARMFPIPPGKTTRIELELARALGRSGSLVELRHPLRTSHVSRAPVQELSVQVTITSEEPIRTVYSPSHEVKVVKEGDHKAKVLYEASQVSADRDFVLLYGLSGRPVGATLFAHGDEGEEGAFLLLLAPSPDLGSKEVVKKDVVFVVDTSGSMAGPKLEQTREALRHCIHRLNPGDRFEVISFSTGVRTLFTGLEPADEEHRGKALAFVKEMSAVGGTNIHEALVRAMSLEGGAERPRMIIFLTDGQPTVGETRTETILGDVSKAAPDAARLFVFGVGEDLNAELLDLLAERNHGSRDYVGAEEDIELKVSGFFDKVSHPVLSGVSLTFKGVAVHDTYPRELPDLFHGTQLLVTGLFRDGGDAEVVLEGKVNGKPQRHTFEVDFRDGGKGTAFVPRLWAVRKVGYLMDQIRLNGPDKELVKEVVRLGKTYGIVTPYTSYLVVDDAALTAHRGRTERLGIGGGRGGPGNTDRWGRGEATGARAPGAESPEARRARGIFGLLPEEKERDGDDETPMPGAGGEGQNAPRTKDGRPSTNPDALEGLVRLRGYLRDSDVELSKKLKNLRESRTGEPDLGTLVRRVGNRTFYGRRGAYVEAPILDMKPATVKEKLVRIEAFSKAYMKLLEERPELAPVLALGSSLLFVDGERLVQVVPPGEKAGPADKGSGDGR